MKWQIVQDSREHVEMMSVIQLGSKRFFPTIFLRYRTATGLLTQLSHTVSRCDGPKLTRRTRPVFSCPLS